jgi:hypothetical protein
MATNIRSRNAYGARRTQLTALVAGVLGLAAVAWTRAGEAQVLNSGNGVTLASIPMVRPANSLPGGTTPQSATMPWEEEKQFPFATPVLVFAPYETPAKKEPATPLDSRRLFALGMIETGNDDREVGGLGEISRYQIHPAVWKAYSSSRDYRNPVVALHVAERHWNYLAGYFREKSGREPDDFDMYVLWNTRFGYYARRNFDRHQIFRVVQDRAQRFVNLVNRRAG